MTVGVRTFTHRDNELTDTQPRRTHSHAVWVKGSQDSSIIILRALTARIKSSFSSLTVVCKIPSATPTHRVNRSSVALGVQA